MIQFVKTDDGIEITEQFSEYEFFEFLKETLLDNGDYQVFEAAMVKFLSEGEDNDAISDQLEKITSFIEQLNTQAFNKTTKLHKLAIIYGHVILQPFYKHKVQTIQKTFSFYQKLVQDVQELLNVDWKAVVYINGELPPFQRHLGENEKRLQENNRLNIIKYPGLLLPLTQLLKETFPQVLIEIYNQHTIYQYYQYEDYQLQAMESLTYLIFHNSNNLLDYQQKMLVQALKFLYQQYIFRNENEEFVQMLTNMIYNIINNSQNANKALICTWIKEFLPQNIKLERSILDTLLKLIEYDTVVSLQIILQYIGQSIENNSIHIESFNDILTFLTKIAPHQNEESYNLQIGQQHGYILNMIYPTIIEQFENLFNIKQLKNSEVSLDNIMYMNVFQLLFIDFAIIFNQNVILDELQLQRTIADIIDKFTLDDESINSSIQNIVLLFIYSKVVTNLSNVHSLFKQASDPQQIGSIILLILSVIISFQENKIRNGSQSELFNIDINKTAFKQIIDELEKLQFSSDLFKQIQSFYYNYIQEESSNLNNSSNITIEWVKSNLLKSEKYIISQIIEQNITDNKILIYIFEQSTYLSEEHVKAFVDYIFQQLFTDKINFQCYFEILDVLYNCYDISPRLSSKINLHLKVLNNTDQLNLIKQVGILYLLQEYGYLQQQYTLSKVQAILESKSSNETIYESTQQDKYAYYFHIYLLKIILSVQNDIYGKYKNFINKLSKYILQFAYSNAEKHNYQFDVYRQFTIELQIAHINQKSGLSIFLNNVSKYLNDLLNDEVHYGLKVVYITLLSIQQFENERVSTKDFNKVCDYTLHSFSKKEMPTVVVEALSIYYRNYLLHQCNVAQISKNQTLTKIISVLLDVFSLDYTNTVLQTLYLQILNSDILNLIATNIERRKYVIQDGAYVLQDNNFSQNNQLTQQQTVKWIVESIIKSSNSKRSQVEQQNHEILQSYVYEGIENKLYTFLPNDLISKCLQCIQSNDSSEYDVSQDDE